LRLVYSKKKTRFFDLFVTCSVADMTLFSTANCQSFAIFFSISCELTQKANGFFLFFLASSDVEMTKQINSIVRFFFFFCFFLKLSLR